MDTSTQVPSKENKKVVVYYHDGTTTTIKDVSIITCAGTTVTAFNEGDAGTTVYEHTFTL